MLLRNVTHEVVYLAPFERPSSGDVRVWYNYGTGVHGDALQALQPDTDVLIRVDWWMDGRWEERLDPIQSDADTDWWDRAGCHGNCAFPPRSRAIFSAIRWESNVHGVWYVEVNRGLLVASLLAFGAFVLSEVCGRSEDDSADCLGDWRKWKSR